jgi:hypothetical protein
MTMTTYQADYYVDDDNDGETEKRIAVAVFATNFGDDHAFDHAEKLGHKNDVTWDGLTVATRDKPARTRFFHLFDQLVLEML